MRNRGGVVAERADIVSRRWAANGLLLLTAVVWGLAFVAQRVGMDYVGPFTFNAARFALGGGVLWGIIRLREARNGLGDRARKNRRRRWWEGALLGTVLFGGASLQQVGLVYTTAGKAGFITGLYVVLVPLVDAWMGARHDVSVWVGAMLALAGLYLLSVTSAWHIQQGDLLVLLSALFWTAHVLLVDRLVAHGDSLRLAAQQFSMVALLSALVAMFGETISLNALRGALWAILYGGLISVGVGYTLQVVAQRYTLPSHAAIILSLESVFALLGGVLLLSEPLATRGVAGSLLMLAGMLVSQKSGGFSEQR